MSQKGDQSKVRAFHIPQKIAALLLVLFDFDVEKINDAINTFEEIFDVHNPEIDKFFEVMNPSVIGYSMRIYHTADTKETGHTKTFSQKKMEIRVQPRYLPKRGYKHFIFKDVVPFLDLGKGYDFQMTVEPGDMFDDYVNTIFGAHPITLSEVLGTLFLSFVMAFPKPFNLEDRELPVLYQVDRDCSTYYYPCFFKGIDFTEGDNCRSVNYCVLSRHPSLTKWDQAFKLDEVTGVDIDLSQGLDLPYLQYSPFNGKFGGWFRDLRFVTGPGILKGGIA